MVKFHRILNFAGFSIMIVSSYDRKIAYKQMKYRMIWERTYEP